MLYFGIVKCGKQTWISWNEYITTTIEIFQRKSLFTFYLTNAKSNLQRNEIDGVFQSHIYNAVFCSGIGCLWGPLVFVNLTDIVLLLVTFNGNIENIIIFRTINNNSNWTKIVKGIVKIIKSSIIYNNTRDKALF